MQIDLYTSNLTDKVRIGVNPFTHEEVRFPLDNGLSELQLASVRKYLKSVRAYPAEDNTFVYVPIDNGFMLRIGAVDLLYAGNPACYTIEWDKVTRSLAEILYALCTKSGMALRYELDSVFVFSEINIELVRKRWKIVNKIDDSEALYMWLIARNANK